MRRPIVNRMRMASGELDRTHQHAWRAKTALQAVVLMKGELHRVQRLGSAQAFDGRHPCAIDCNGEARAALHGTVVHVHYTGTALACVATDMRARQSKRLAQEIA